MMIQSDSVKTNTYTCNEALPPSFLGAQHAAFLPFHLALPARPRKPPARLAHAVHYLLVLMLCQIPSKGRRNKFDASEGLMRYMLFNVIVRN